MLEFCRNTTLKAVAQGLSHVQANNLELLYTLLSPNVQRALTGHILCEHAAWNVPVGYTGQVYSQTSDFQVFRKVGGRGVSLQISTVPAEEDAFEA